MSKSDRYFHPESQLYVNRGEAFKLLTILPGEDDASSTTEWLSYPDNWIDVVSEEEIASVGLVPVVVTGTAKDDRFYDNSTVVDGASVTIVATPKDLDAVRESKWALVKEIRSQLVAAALALEASPGVTVGFQADRDSRVQYITLKDRARDMAGAGALGSAQITFGGEGVVWKTVENSYVPITIDLIHTIVESLAIRELAIFAAGERKYVALQASEDPASFDVNSDWE